MAYGDNPGSTPAPRQKKKKRKPPMAPSAQRNARAQERQYASQGEAVEHQANRQRRARKRHERRMVQTSRQQERQYAAQGKHVEHAAKRQRREVRQRQQRELATLSRILNQRSHLDEPLREQRPVVPLSGAAAIVATRNNGEPTISLSDIGDTLERTPAALGSSVQRAIDFAQRLGAITPDQKLDYDVQTSGPGAAKPGTMAKRVGEDLANVAIQAVPALYQLGAAGVEAAQGDTERAKKLGKAYADNTALGQLIIHGDPEAAVEQVVEHPGLAGLGALGVYGTLGRIAGTGVRGATGGRRGSRERDPLKLLGDQEIPRDYSPNLFTATAQKASDKRASARAQKHYDRAELLRKQEAELRAQGEHAKAHEVHRQFIEAQQTAMRIDPNQATGKALKHEQKVRLGQLHGGLEITRRENRGTIDKTLGQAEPRKSPRKKIGGLPAKYMDTPVIGEMLQAMRDDATPAEVVADLRDAATFHERKLNDAMEKGEVTVAEADASRAYIDSLRSAVDDPKFEQAVPALSRFARTARAIGERQEPELAGLGMTADARLAAKYLPAAMRELGMERFPDGPKTVPTAAGLVAQGKVEHVRGLQGELRKAETELATARGMVQASRLPKAALASHEKTISHLESELAGLTSRTSEVGISEFRGGQTSGRKAELKADTRALADEFGVEVKAVRPTVGRYLEDTGPVREDSFVVRVKGPEKRVDAYAAALGEKYDQESAGIFTRDPKGEHSSYTLKGITDFDGAYAEADKLGLYASSKVGKNLNVWVDNPEDAARVAELAGRLGVDVSESKGHVKFIGSSEYAKRVSDGGVPQGYARARDRGSDRGGLRPDAGRRARGLLQKEAQHAARVRGQLQQAQRALKRAEGERDRRAAQLADKLDIERTVKQNRDALRGEIKLAREDLSEFVASNRLTTTREFHIGGVPTTLREAGEMLEAKGFRPGFLTHKEVTAAGHFRPNTSRASVGPKSRTGRSYELGLMDATGQGIRESLQNTQTRIDSTKAFDATIQDIGLGIFEPGNTAAIERAVEQANATFPELGPFTTVRVMPFIEKAEMLAAVDDLYHGAAFDQNIGGLIGEMIESAQKPGAGPVAVVPEKLVGSWKELAIGPVAKNDASRALRWFTQNFRWTVLPFSTRWVTGNTVEAAGRSAVAGHGLLDVYTGFKSVRRMGEMVAEGKITPDQYQRFMSLGIGGRHFGSVLDQFVSHTGERKITDVAGARYVVRGLRGMQHKILQANRRIEDVFAMAGIGQVVARDAHRLAADMGRFNHRAADIMDAAIEKRALDVNKVVELKGYLDRTLGRYSGHSSAERWWITNYAPFWDWYRNAMFFVLWSLPHDHPQVAGLIAGTEQAIQQDLQNDGQVMFGTGLPSYLKGSIPSGDARIRLQYYTPFGAFGDPVGGAADVLLPQVSGAVLAGLGLDWRGQPLNGQHGPEATVAQKALVAGNSIVESQVPFIRQIRTLREKGGSAGPYSTVLFPQTREGTERSTGAGALRLVNPLTPTRPGNKAPASGGNKLPQGNRLPRRRKLPAGGSKLPLGAKLPRG